MTARTILVVLEQTDLESLDVAELILAKDQLRVVDAGYQGLKLETPEWVIDKMTELNAEITARVKGELQRRLRAARARRADMRTLTEKRQDLDAEIEALEQTLKP